MSDSVGFFFVCNRSVEYRRMLARGKGLFTLSKCEKYDKKTDENFAFTSREWTLSITVNFTFNCHCLERSLAFSGQFSQRPCHSIYMFI